MYVLIYNYIYCIVLHVLLWSTVQRITIHVIRFLSVMSRISQRPQVVHQQKGLMSRPVVVEISTCRCGFSLWLCQNSYGKWLSIVDFPIQNGDFPSFFGTVYQRVASKFQLKPQKKVSHHMFMTNHQSLVCCSLPCDLSPTQHLLDDPFTVPGSPLQGSNRIWLQDMVLLMSIPLTTWLLTPFFLTGAQYSNIPGIYGSVSKPLYPWWTSK